MRTLLLLVVLWGCDKAKDQPTPAPTPTPTPTPSPAPADASTVATETACDNLIVFLETGGIWLGAPPNIACFAENTQGGNRDTEWFESELKSIQARLGSCKPSVEVAAANGVTYQDVIQVMDLSSKLGLPDVGLSGPIDLSMKFTMTKQRSCKGALATTSSGKVKKPRARMGTGDLKTSPVVVVSKTEITFNSESVLSVADAMKESNKLPIPELQRAIPTGATMVILQADAATDAKVLNRVIKTIHDAGIEDVLFAVKNR